MTLTHGGCFRVKAVGLQCSVRGLRTTAELQQPPAWMNSRSVFKPGAPLFSCFALKPKYFKQEQNNRPVARRGGHQTGWLLSTGPRLNSPVPGLHKGRNPNMHAHPYTIPCPYILSPYSIHCWPNVAPKRNKEAWGPYLEPPQGRTGCDAFLPRRASPTRVSSPCLASAQ